MEDQKITTDVAAKVEADKAQAKAPDAEKLQLLLDEIRKLQMPKVSSAQGEITMVTVKNALNSIVKFLKSGIKELGE